MDIAWQTTFADVPTDKIDVARSFWAAVTDSTATAPRGDRDELPPLQPSGGDSSLWLQRVGRPEGGWHLDLHVENLAAAVQTAEALGAVTTTTVPDLVTMTSPAGQPFCLVNQRDQQRRPRPSAWSGGHRSLLDQICLDIPATDFDDECRFWAALTGWERQDGTLPEYVLLVKPERLPLRLLLQRLGDDDTGGIRAHADFASEDVSAEQARHERLGATLVRRAQHWTTLRDPAGLEYCITDRKPQEHS